MNRFYSLFIRPVSLFNRFHRRLLMSGPILCQQYQTRRHLVPPSTCVLWCKSLAQLLSSGLPMRSAVEVLKLDGDRRSLVLNSECMLALERGLPLSKALEHRVPMVLIQWLQLAEVSGDLPKRLTNYVEQMEQRMAWRGKLTRTLAYPAVLLFMTFILLGFVSLSILPMFLKMDLEFGTRTDATSIWIARVLHIFPFGVLLLLAFVSLGGIWAYLYLQTTGIRKIQKGFLKSLWVWLLVYQTQRISGDLGVMLANGVPIIEALSQMGSRTQRSWQKEMFESILQKIEQGVSLSTASEPYVVATATYLLRIAEETGELGDTLLRIEANARHRLHTTIEQVIQWIEPLLLVFMGLIVLLTMYAVFMPMYNFISTLSK
jgi:type II secretory pathway component PulF